MTRKSNQINGGKRCPECGNVLERKDEKKSPSFGISGTETVLKCPNCGYKKKDPFRNISFFHNEG